jgi:hypothetical protein
LQSKNFEKEGEMAKEKGEEHLPSKARSSLFRGLWMHERLAEWGGVSKIIVAYWGVAKW